MWVSSKGEVHADLRRSQDLLQRMLRCAYITWIMCKHFHTHLHAWCLCYHITADMANVRHQICTGRAAKRFTIVANLSGHPPFTDFLMCHLAPAKLRTVLNAILFGASAQARIAFWKIDYMAACADQEAEAYHNTGWCIYHKIGVQ